MLLCQRKTGLGPFTLFNIRYIDTLFKNLEKKKSTQGTVGNSKCPEDALDAKTTQEYMQ